LGVRSEGFPTLREPRLQALYLAFAEAGRPAYRARELAPPLFGLRCDQLRYSECDGDGPRDEGVGGGDQDAEIGRMARHERFRRRADDGQDSARHEFAVPRIEHGPWMARQGFQLKIKELADVEHAGLVLVVELLVARFVDLPVEHSLL